MTYEHTHGTSRQQNHKLLSEHIQNQNITKTIYRHAHHGTWLGSPRSSHCYVIGLLQVFPDQHCWCDGCNYCRPHNSVLLDRQKRVLWPDVLAFGAKSPQLLLQKRRLPSDSSELDGRGAECQGQKPAIVPEVQDRRAGGCPCAKSPLQRFTGLKQEPNFDMEQPGWFLRNRSCH